jgi:hypothetical protein
LETRISVVDLEPQGSGTFCRIRNSEISAPDPGLNWDLKESRLKISNLITKIPVVKKTFFKNYDLKRREKILK